MKYSFIRNQPLARKLLAGPRKARQRWLDYRSEPALEAIQTMQDMIVGDVTVAVEEFGGRFAMSPHSHIFKRLALYGHYEPELAAIFLDAVQPDKDALDVGANLGFFSCAVAKKLGSGRVLAVEPTDGAHRRLLHNLALNGVEDRVVVFKGLAADSDGDSEIHFIEGMEEYSSIKKSEHPAVAGMDMSSMTVASETIDRLVARHGLKPAVMKVDVEGAEAKVFEGAQTVLREHRPLVLAELNRPMLADFGSSPEAIVGMFQSLGYRTVDPLHPGVAPGTNDFGDLLCIP